MNPKDLEWLVTREMPLGMHKGWIIADLPGNYLNWFARNGFPPGEIGRLLALMQEIDHNGLADILTPLRQRSGNPFGCRLIECLFQTHGTTPHLTGLQPARSLRGRAQGSRRASSARSD